MSKIRNLLPFAVAIILLAAGIYFLFQISPALLGTLGLTTKSDEAARAPDFALYDLDGEKFRLSDAAGKDIIIVFWASWNEASVEEVKILDNYERPRDSIIALAINSQENKEAARAVRERLGLGLRILLDEDGAVGEAYNIGILPKTVFIGKSGSIRRGVVGLQAIEDLIK